MSHYEKLHSTNGAYWLKEAADKQYRLHGKASGVKSFYGHKIESQAGIIDGLLIEGRFTIEQMAVSAKFKSGKIAKSRVRQHLYAKLRDILNVDIQADSKGRIFAACNATSLENNKAVNAAEAKAAKAAEAGRVRHIAATKRQAKIDQKIAKNG